MRINRTYKILAVLLLFLMILTGCGSSSGSGQSGTKGEADTGISGEQTTGGEESTTASAEQSTGEETSNQSTTDAQAPQIEGLTYVSTMKLNYAKCFNVHYYQDGYKLIDIPLSGQYLIIPDGAQDPEGLDEEIVKIYQPLDQIYLAATGSMSFFDKLDAIDNVTMSSLDVGGWAIQAPVDAMKAGRLTFAGKYSEPDYEMLVQNGCDLALESTMILHTPEVQEMIEDLGIPVMIDRSSYEKDVLGRIEWVKLYGALLNKEDVAEEAFASQKAIVDSMEEYENTGKTVAFFSMNSDKSVVVRKSSDIIPNMIEIAGGKYIFDSLDDPTTKSASMNLTMEEFYKTAVDADYIIYNGTIETPLSSVDDLLGKDELFAEFKAVKEGNVWTVDKTWYQDTSNVANLIVDMNIMLEDKDPSGLTFMYKVSK